MVKQHEGKSGFQSFLDFLSSPVPMGAANKEEAEADVIVMKGYWEAIAIRDKAQLSDVHQHLHLGDCNDGDEAVINRVQKAKRVLAGAK